MACRRVRHRPPGPRRSRDSRDSRGSAADELAVVYAAHARPLLRLAVLLVPDTAAAREVVYEAFAALSRDAHRPRRAEDTLAFLLRTVVRLARDIAGSARISASGLMPEGEGEGEGAALVRAVRALPEGQRDALILRYYSQLSDEQAAAAMGIHPDALRTNVMHGMAALRFPHAPRIFARE